MKTSNIKNLGLLVAIAVLSTGCVMPGNSPTTQDSQSKSTNTQNTFPTPLPSPSPSPSPTPSPSPSATPRSGAILSFRAEATGYREAKILVTTRRILRVRFTPGQQDQKVAGTGFSPTYSKLGVYLRVNGTSTPTPMLFNGAGAAGGSAQKSGIIDFSGAISAGCAANNSTCSQTVEIVVERPNNDYWCYNYGMYCPWTNVYDTHPWNGTLEVETDFTGVMQ